MTQLSHPRLHLGLALVAGVALLAAPTPALAFGHGHGARDNNGGEIQAADLQRAPLPDGPTTVLRLSGLYSYGGGRDVRNGFGADARLRIYPGETPLFVGTFGQGQYELGEAWRFAGGLTAGFGMFALEVGVAQRTTAGNVAGSTGLHIAKAIDLGPVTLGGRITIPFTNQRPQNVEDVQTQGVEGAFFVRMGFDLTLSGTPRRYAGGCSGPRGHGGRHGHQR
ncbi:MAG: hypothetical protein ACFCGT_12375 [Sandaracinaceae bacterium]